MWSVAPASEIQPSTLRKSSVRLSAGPLLGRRAGHELMGTESTFSVYTDPELENSVQVALAESCRRDRVGRARQPE